MQTKRYGAIIDSHSIQMFCHINDDDDVILALRLKAALAWWSEYEIHDTR